MAAVLEALLPYVTKLITDMAEQEVGLLLGVHGEMEKLGRNLGNVKAFLADAERRRIRDELVQGWVRMLKGVMYDATDVLELGQLKVEERREKKMLGRSVEEMVPGCCQPFLFCLRNPVFAHKIGSRIKELNQRLEEIHQEAAKFNFIANLSSYPEQRTQAAEYSSSQRMTSEFIPSAVVGEQIEKDTSLLVQELITTGESHHTLKVVSIVGMGGIGKTTHAQKIFKDATINKHFKIKIWLSITQQFNDVELLRSAIKHAGGDPGTEQDNTLLTQNLTSTLSESKFLLVLDDMWSITAWESVLGVPVTNSSDKQPGSKVLITTRFEDLAPQMHDSVYQHHVSTLSKDDAWSLLKNQLSQLPNQVAGLDHLKEVGMKIIRKCGGLPLAIKIMGGLLRTKPRTELEWEAILNHNAWSLDGLPRELDHRLYLSYEHLSPQVKQCFLYCSLIPKGSYIYKEIIISMWISEGFVQTRDGSRSSPEEVAAEYYHELIVRNLIEPMDAGTKYRCTMHDVVRSFAEFMARDESLVLHDEPFGSIGLVRRLCVASTKSVTEWALLEKQESLRTLIIDCKINVKPCDSLTSFSGLRVLFIKQADSDKLVDSICQLRHLRHLQFCETNISKLPDDIHRLKFLQHLVFVDCRSLEKLPSSIIKLAHLRKFAMHGSHDVLIPKGFGGMTNLRFLLGFPVHVETDGAGCSLEEIAPLSQLRVLSLSGLENVWDGSWAEKAQMSSKDHLSFVELIWSSKRYEGLRDGLEKQKQQEAAEEVLEKLCPPACIDHLRIEGYLGRHPPSWMMGPEATTLIKSLRILALDLPCCTQLPDGLCRLPSFESLNIKNAPAIKRVGPEFQGAVVPASTSTAAFPSLTELALQGLCEWEEWEWEDQGEGVTMMAMPALERLVIGNCKLSRLPPGLASSKRHALRILCLYDLSNLTWVENFPSVVELVVFRCSELKRISGLSRLQRIKIVGCPNLEVLEGAPALDSMELRDQTMEILPEYLRGVNPRHFQLNCSRELSQSISTDSSEWDKIRHISSHVIYYWDPDLKSWTQVALRRDRLAGGVRLQQETGSSPSRVSPAVPTA